MNGRAPATRRRRTLLILLWGWVIAGFIAYLHQFGRLIDPIMQQIGGGP